MSPEQERKKEEARQEAIRNTNGVCATGEKYNMPPPANQIDNE